MTAAEETFLEKLSRFTDDQLSNPALSPDDLCREMHISRTHLFRVIKNHTGLSITLYIRHRRMLRAWHLLTTTELRITEVATEVGIASPQNFSKYFTEHFGVSPSGLRRTPTVATPEPPPVFFVTPSPAEASTGDTIIKAPPVADSIPATSPAAVSSLRNQRRSWLIFGGVALLAVGLLSWLLTEQNVILWPVSAPESSIAILPFRNNGPTIDEPLVDGIANDIRTVLSLDPTLKVIARSSSGQYEHTQKPNWQIGNELKVSKLLRGSVSRRGKGLVIALELVRARDNSRLWSKTYSGSYSYLFRMTNQIGQEVQQQLGQATQRPARPEPTTSMAAYSAFLQGRQLMLTRSEDKIRASIAKFDEALALDSVFADAYAYRAVSYQVLSNMGYVNDKAILALVEQNALRAIRLDSTNSTAYATLGSLYADTFRWQQADMSFQLALRYHPNDAQANYWYSLLLRSTGRLDEAQDYSAKALLLDPLYPVMMTGHVANCAYAGRFDLADETLANGKLLFGDSFLYHFGRGLYSLAKEDYGLGVAAYREVLRLNPDFTTQIPSLLYCEARLGQTARARAYVATPAHTPQDDYNRAVVWAGLGNRTNCLRFLRRAADGGFIYKDMLVFPVFRPYHHDPAFRAILRQYGLPESR